MTLGLVRFSLTLLLLLQSPDLAKCSNSSRMGPYTLAFLSEDPVVKQRSFLEQTRRSHLVEGEVATSDAAVCDDGYGSEEERSGVSGARNGEIRVSTNIELPFPVDVAYNAFSDLTRQPSFSPWLRSVEYLSDDHEDAYFNNANGPTTTWTMSYFGLRFSWNSIAREDRNEGVIEWKSIKGLKNNGRVEFRPISNGRQTHMIMTMTMALPRIAARLLGGKSTNSLAHLVETRMLQKTLNNFRQEVEENDWKRIQLEQQQRVLMKQGNSSAPNET